MYKYERMRTNDTDNGIPLAQLGMAKRLGVAGGFPNSILMLMDCFLFLSASCADL